jgi:hypothetical protein
VTATLAAAVALVGVPALTSHADEPSTTSDGSQAAWTLMIYDVADTESIPDEMIRNLAELAALPDMSNVNVVALVDLPEKNDPAYPTSTLPGVAPFTDTELLLLKDNKWNVVRDEGELEMGRPDTLSNFIVEAADRYPAQKYGLVLSDHGGAWYGGYLDNGPPEKSRLSVADIRTGMLEGMQQAGIDRFDLLDHDACLMSSYEVASALAPLAKVEVGSEEETLGDSTLSPGAITALGQDVSAEDWGKDNIEQYAQWVDTEVPSASAFSSLSVIDGDKMSTLDAAMESFANVAVQHMSEIAPQLARARAQALEFAVGLSGQDGSFNAVDLGDFMKHLTDVPDDVAVARDAVSTALQGVVLDQVTRQGTQQSTGLNVFFPGANKVTAAEENYYVGNEVAPPAWEKLVQAFTAASGSAGGNGSGAATFASAEAHIDVQDPSGIRISGQLQDGQTDNVTDSQTQVFTQADGQTVLAAGLPAYVNAGAAGTVQGVWDYGMPAISSGKQQLFGTGIFQAQSGGLVGNLYAHYTSPQGEQSDVDINMLMDSSGNITSVSVGDANAGTTAGITLEAGGTLTPYYFVAGDDGFHPVASQQTLKIKESLSVDYPQLAAGTPFEMDLVVVDLAGNASSTSISSTVPEGRTR